MNRKRSYKVELIYVKYSPMVISLGLLISSILAYFDVYINNYVGYVCGASFLTIGHMYNSSIVHKFCTYHRLFIYYIVVNNTINIADYYLKLNTTDKQLLVTHCIIAGIFLFLILYYYTKRRKEDYGTDEGYKKVTLPNYRRY